MNQQPPRCCKGKVRHATWTAAMIALKISGSFHGDLTMVVYRCSHCRGFHVGHPKPSVQKRLRFSRLLRLIEKANGER